MIDVLLATHRPNAAWLKEQIDSILSQKGVEINLIQREDVEGFGACGNFGALLERSRADYVAFSDQDDVWLPEKLAISLEKIRELEMRWGKETPLLVFTDAYVADSTLHVLGTNFSRQRINVKSMSSFPRLMMQNFIPGNAMLFNAALRTKAGAIPRSAMMHDCWLAWVATAFGHIGFVDSPLYYYRQHVSNVIGASRFSLGLVRKRFTEGRHEFRRRLEMNVRQAQAFVERYRDSCPESVRVLATINGLTKFEKLYAITRYKLFKQGFLRNLALFLWC